MGAPVAQTAWIGLGSNLGDRVATLVSALRALAALPDTTVRACSGLYRSAPVGPVTDQPDFLNAACRLETGIDPVPLMRALLDIETRHGRRRDTTAAGGPRTLDLDLLLYGATVGEWPGLRLPHPRLHARAFVLYPLNELSAELDIPGQGRVTDLLPACAGQGIERIGMAGWPPAGF
jgi:2-amino-4-hydroxy-6-hydroxymethyldihydropteridine diphosphokinase